MNMYIRSERQLLHPLRISSSWMDTCGYWVPLICSIHSVELIWCILATIAFTVFFSFFFFISKLARFLSLFAFVNNFPVFIRRKSWPTQTLRSKFSWVIFLLLNLLYWTQNYTHTVRFGTVYSIDHFPIKRNSDIFFFFVLRPPALTIVFVRILRTYNNIWELQKRKIVSIRFAIYKRYLKISIKNCYVRE